MPYYVTTYGDLLENLDNLNRIKDKDKDKVTYLLISIQPAHSVAAPVQNNPKPMYLHISRTLRKEPSQSLLAREENTNLP